MVVEVLTPSYPNSLQSAARLKSCTARTNRIPLAPRSIVEQAQVLAHQVLPQVVCISVPLVVSFLVREVAILGLVAVSLPLWVIQVLSLLCILAVSIFVQLHTTFVPLLPVLVEVKAGIDMRGDHLHMYNTA